MLQKTCGKIAENLPITINNGLVVAVWPSSYSDLHYNKSVHMAWTPQKTEYLLLFCVSFLQSHLTTNLHTLYILIASHNSSLQICAHSLDFLKRHRVDCLYVLYSFIYLCICSFLVASHNPLLKICAHGPDSSKYIGSFNCIFVVRRYVCMYVCFLFIHKASHPLLLKICTRDTCTL